jgi:hypothetical protein
MEGVLFGQSRYEVPSSPLDEFSHLYFPEFRYPMDGVKALWAEHAAGAATMEHFTNLETALSRGAESGQIVLLMMYMENLESLTVKPSLKSVLFTHLTFDLFATGKFLTKLRSYTRIGTRELRQPPMSFIGFPAMFGQSMRTLQLGPGPLSSLDEGYDDDSPERLENHPSNTSLSTEAH